MAKVEDEVQTYPIESPEEMARLSNQHEVIKDAMGGLLLVPVDLSIGAKRILDSGTADGDFPSLFESNFRFVKTQTHYF